MTDSNNTVQAGECMVCHQEFTYTVRPGRPPQLCGDECRRVAGRLRVRRYHKRLTDARDQLAALRAAQAA
jgi:hypothetical protein